MGRKKLNFSRTDFKKSDAQSAGFTTKGAALKFFKSTPKNKLDNFKSVDELVEYIKNQKDKLKTFGLDVDFLYKQKPRLTKEQKGKKEEGKELEKQLKDYEEALSGPEKIDSDTFIFKKIPQANEILKYANKFYNNKKISIPKNFDYTNFKKEKKKTFNYAYNDEPLELSQLLYSIFNQQKYRYKINISFAFTLIKEERIDKNTYEIKFKFFDASTNTRIFEHPRTIDNKQNIDALVQDVLKQNLIDKLTRNRDGSLWKFYEFLYVRFDIYEMDSPIGAPIELPQHLLTGSNKKYLIKYNNHDDNLCFWRCLAYCIYKPDDTRSVENHVINLFNEYYENKNDIKNYNGVSYIEYNKYYDEENEETLIDEVSKIEKFFKMNINVYNNDISTVDEKGNEEYVVEIERRSMTNYEETLNLMRYENHFMYIKDLDQGSYPGGGKRGRLQ